MPSKSARGLCRPFGGFGLDAVDLDRADLRGGVALAAAGQVQMNNPDLAVRLETSDNLVDFAREDISVAIRAGKRQLDRADGRSG